LVDQQNRKITIMATNHLTFTRNSLIAATLGAGIAMGTIVLLVDEYAPEPTIAVSYDIGAPQEDEPGWDCNTMGNRVCAAPMTEDDPGWDCSVNGNRVCDILDAAKAWQAWDASDNALELGNQSTRIEYVGKSDVPVPGHMLVDGYLFRIIYPTI
jgi:hypothetical protein